MRSILIRELTQFLLNAPECYGYAAPFGLGVWPPHKAVAYASGLPGRRYAYWLDSPFYPSPIPPLTCP